MVFTRGVVLSQFGSNSRLQDTLSAPVNKDNFLAFVADIVPHGTAEHLHLHVKHLPTLHLLPIVGYGTDVQVCLHDILFLCLFLALGTTLDGRGNGGSTRCLGLHVTRGRGYLLLGSGSLSDLCRYNNLREGRGYLEAVLVFYIYETSGSINTCHTSTPYRIEKTDLVTNVYVFYLLHNIYCVECL